MQTEKKRATYLKQLQQWLPIGISILALIASLVDVRVVLEQNEREKIFSPLNFRVFRGAQTATYQVASPDGTLLQEIPGYEIVFSCQTGAYREFTQIYYDGTTLEMASADLDVLKSAEEQRPITSTGQIPQTGHSPGETAYDYCFILTTSAAGQRELWLLYYELDLAANTVRGPFRASDTLLLSLQDPEDPAKADMLRNYQALYALVEALPGA